MNTERELAVDELDALAGGLSDLSISKHFDVASSGGGDGGGGGGGGGGDVGPAINAWNDLLRNYGYIK
jgi:hypothetical protein